MQTLYCIGVQVEFKNLVKHIRKRFHVPLAFPGLSHLVAFCHIHTNTLEFRIPIFTNTFCDPTKNMNTGPITTKQSHLAGNRSICQIYSFQILGKSAAFFCRDHEENIALIQLQVVLRSFFPIREAQQLHHLLVDISNSRLLFTGVS